MIEEDRYYPKNKRQMKTINLKLEVKDQDDECIEVYLGENISYWIPKFFIEEHQVLTVKEVQEYCRKNRVPVLCDKYGEFHNNGKHLGLSDLTDLIKGKERTLEDVVKDLIEVMDRSGAFQIDMLKNLKEEAEQLLKNKE